MSDTTYRGSCHCGAVRYRVTMNLESAVTCNCSICSRTGAMLAFAPADRFVLESGRESLSDYQFGRKNIHHYFCRTCGVRSFAQGRGPGGVESVAVNVRCLEGVDLTSIPIRQFDGKSLPIA
jgi:hypothetical protein